MLKKQSNNTIMTNTLLDYLNQKENEYIDVQPWLTRPGLGSVSLVLPWFITINNKRGKGETKQKHEIKSKSGLKVKGKFEMRAVIMATTLNSSQRGTWTFFQRSYLNIKVTELHLLNIFLITDDRNDSLIQNDTYQSISSWSMLLSYDAFLPLLTSSTRSASTTATPLLCAQLTTRTWWFSSL